VVLQQWSECDAPLVLVLFFPLPCNLRTEVRQQEPSNERFSIACHRLVQLNFGFFVPHIACIFPTQCRRIYGRTLP